MAYFGSPKKYHMLRGFIHSLDGGRCHICGRRVEIAKAVLDHIIPIQSFGMFGVDSSDEYWNLRIAHVGCNSRRGPGRLPGQMRLPIPIEVWGQDVPK